MNKWMCAGICGVIAIGLVASVRAEPWTLPRDGMFVTASFMGTRSRSLFNNEADKVAFLNNGLSRVGSIAVEGAYGIFDRVMISASVPLLFYRLSDDFVREEGVSLGDVRGAVRYRWLNRQIISAFELRLKFPTATETDPSRIQVGEGQYDVAAVGSVGWLWRRSSVSFDVGYRYRMRNSNSGFKPGDEILFRVDANRDLLERVSVGVSLEGFLGRAGNARVFGLHLLVSRSQRRLISVTPSVAYLVTDHIGLNLQVSVPFVGRNYYAGHFVALGLSFGNTRTRPGASNAIPSPRGGSCCAIQ